MLIDVIEVEALEGCRLRLRFEDGVEGIADLEGILRFHGVFAPLEDVAYSAMVRVDPEPGTVAWPNGVDLDADVLYSRVTGCPIHLGG